MSLSLNYQIDYSGENTKSPETLWHKVTTEWLSIQPGSRHLSFQTNLNELENFVILCTGLGMMSSNADLTRVTEVPANLMCFKFEDFELYMYKC